MRCLHEAELHTDNCFVTLTYDPDHLRDHSLHVDDLQRFWKRLRKEIHPHRLRYYACGEYGELNARPHYHALIFGYRFPDERYSHTRNGFRLNISNTLDRIWGQGNCFIGEVSFDSAAYVSRYITKKLLGATEEELQAHYQGREPEFVVMSRKPGIAAGWFDKYVGDVYPQDYTIVNGQKCRPPRYYDKIFDGRNPDGFETIKDARRARSREMVPKHLRLQGRISQVEDSDPYERLPVKETVTKAKLSLKKREI